jgi:hypothetical protein
MEKLNPVGNWFSLNRFLPGLDGSNDQIGLILLT